MKKKEKISNLEHLLWRLGEAADKEDRVAIGSMLEVVGQKSFGPLLVFSGIIAFSPLSGIPGVPTLVGLIVFLTAIQLLLRRKHFWLPKWLLHRTISRSKYEKSLKMMLPAARFVDRFFRPRLALLTQRTGAYIIAVVCVVIALAMPPMEVVPFAATTAGAALTALGLSLIAHDGVMALIALLFIGVAATVLIPGIF
jgi:hypothetical protein